MRVLVVVSFAAACCAGVADAREPALPEARYPTLPERGASAAAFTPNGWKLEKTGTGDLNADGLADLALVLRQDDPRFVVVHDGFGASPFDSNPRILAIAFAQRGGGYRLAASDHGLIPRPQSPTLSDPFGEGDLAIVRGALRVRLDFFASAGGWTMFNATHTLRWQNGRFELIGYDRNMVQRNTGEMKRISVNYSTRKARIETGNISEDAVKTRWVTLPSARPRTLGEIGDGLEFEPDL